MGQTCDSKICKNSDVRDCQKAFTKTHDKPFLMILGVKFHGTRKGCILYLLYNKRKKERNQKKAWRAI